MTIPNSGRYNEATRALHDGSSYLVSESWHFIKSAMQSIAWSCIAVSLERKYDSTLNNQNCLVNSWYDLLAFLTPPLLGVLPFLDLGLFAGGMELCPLIVVKLIIMN